MTEPKVYLSIAELAQHVPFSEQAIRMLMHKGDLRLGEHFFRHGRKVIFKWAAICEWIEGRAPAEPVIGAGPADIVPLRRRA